MTPNNFINRYFESEAILLKIAYSEKRSMTSFMNYLENLHSLTDKLKSRFGCNRHLIIPMRDFAKALKSFIDNTKNEKYVEKQIELIYEVIEHEIIVRVDEIVNLPKISIDGKTYKLGIDVFKHVYNISNIIANECRKIEEELIVNLETIYTKEYNMPKRDLLCTPQNIPLITTKGLILPKNSDSVGGRA